MHTNDHMIPTQVFLPMKPYSYTHSVLKTPHYFNNRIELITPTHKKLIRYLIVSLLGLPFALKAVGFSTDTAIISTIFYPLSLFGLFAAITSKDKIVIDMSNAIAAQLVDKQLRQRGVEGGYINISSFEVNIVYSDFSRAYLHAEYPSHDTALSAAEHLAKRYNLSILDHSVR
jgi:hypothetical protein